MPAPTEAALPGWSRSSVVRSKTRLGLHRRVERLDDSLRRATSRRRRSRPRACARRGGRCRAGRRGRPRTARHRRRPARCFAAPPRRGSAAGACAGRRARRRRAPGASRPAGPGRRRAATACTSRRARGRRERPRRAVAGCWIGVSAPNISLRAGNVNGTSSSRKRATSSTTSTSRVTSRARNVGTTTSPSRLLEAEPLEPARLLGGRRLEADQLVRALGPERDHRALGKLALHVDVPDPLGAGRRDDQLGRELRRLLGQVRVDALLPAVRALGAQAQALGGAVEAGRLEVRGLEQDVGRPFADLGLLAAHDPGDRDGPLGVGDHEVGLLEAAIDAVERPDRLARLRAAHDDLPACERAQVERVQRVPEREHDVVRRVDDVRDRPHARGIQARLQPHGRRADRDVPEEPADVARTAFEVVDRDVHGLVSRRLGIDSRAEARARGRRAQPPRARCRTPRAGRDGCRSTRRGARRPRAGARRRAASRARSRAAA